MSETILWISDVLSEFDRSVLQELSGRFEIGLHKTLPEAYKHLESQPVQAAVLSLPDAGEREIRYLEQIRHVYPRLPIVLRKCGADGQHQNLMERLHVVNCCTETSTPETIIRRIEAAIDQSSVPEPARESRPPSEPWRAAIVGNSPAMEHVVECIRLVASRRATVLITGATGTGKEVIARAIHAASQRAQHPMVTVNCAALPENLLETELFGHAKGAFTGAVGQRMGRFEQAHRGTIFLDEIGDMPIGLQTGLLRVLQEREFQRVGSLETVRTDVRVIAATNVDLDAAVENKTFRRDLLYRLRVFTIHMPPLRERMEDVPALARHFIAKICRDEDIRPKRLPEDVLEMLSNYDWPGNVRELQHAIETASVMSGDREALRTGDFSLNEGRHSAALISDASTRLPDEGVDFEELINNIQRALLSQALERANGNKARAASLLNLKRSTLVSKVKALAE